LTKKHKTEKHNLSKRNGMGIVSGASSDKKSKRCFWASLISAVFVIVLFAMIDDMTFTAYMWQVSWLFIILSVGALGASVYYVLKIKKNAIPEDSLLFTPPLILYFSSLFTIWSVVFALSAHRYIPIFIVINIAFIILYFIYLHFKKDFYSFSLYTAVCAGLIWIIKLFGDVDSGIMGIAILVCAIIMLALLAISLLKGINKNTGIFRNKTVLPFAISFAVSAASLVLSRFVSGYEIYFITGLMIWFIIFGIAKAVQIIEE